MSRRNTGDAFDSVLPVSLFICLTCATGAWLIWDGLTVPLVTYAAFADYWEHTAVLTEWVRNFSAPANPHVVSSDLSSRYMPYFWVLAGLGRILDLSAVQLMSVSLVVNFCLIVLGLQLFLRYYFRDSWAPLFGFIAIFMFWGVGWNWSNLYQLRSFFYIGGYPSSLVFGLSLISFWVSLRLLRQDGSPIVLAAAVALLAALMILCHPLTAVFGIVGCGLLALTETRVSVVMRFTVLVSLLAGTLLAEFWPYFSVWKLMLGQYGSGVEQWGAISDLSPLERFRAGVWKHIFYDPVLVFRILGPALLGIPVLFWLLIKRQQMFIVAGAIVMAIPYVAHLFVEIPLAHRFLLFVVTYLHLALVWFGLTVLSVFRTEPKPMFSRTALNTFALATVAMVGANFALLAGESRGSSLSPEDMQMRDKRFVLPEGKNVIDLYSELTASLDDDSVVLTTASLGWPLPSVRGKVVSLYHENPMLLDQAERYQATGDFFYKPIDEIKRAEIVTRYSASYVLLSDRDPNIRADVADWLSSYSDLISSVGGYRMYRLLDTVPRIEPRIETKASPDPEVINTDPVPVPASTASQASEGEADNAPAIGTEAAQPDIVVTAPEGESVVSFGAPILAPIINVPETVDPEADEPEVTTEPSSADQSSQVPQPEPTPAAQPLPNQQPAESVGTEGAEGGESFGAPIAEPIIELPETDPSPEEPENLIIE